MQRSWLGLSGAILLLLGSALLGGCKQKQGETCQLNSDCSDNFICCVKADPSARTGVCILPESCVELGDAAVPDRSTVDQKVEQQIDKKLAAEQATADKPPATADKPPATPDKPPATPDKPPATPDKPPVTPDKPPVTPDKPPTQ